MPRARSDALSVVLSIDRDGMPVSHLSQSSGSDQSNTLRVKATSTSGLSSIPESASEEGEVSEMEDGLPAVELLERALVESARGSSESAASPKPSVATEKDDLSNFKNSQSKVAKVNPNQDLFKTDFGDQLEKTGSEELPVVKLPVISVIGSVPDEDS